MTIEPVTTQDTEAIYRIARENGLPASWVWPVDCHGGVAKEHGDVVAFCALKEIVWETPFLATEEFWCEQTPEGHRALKALGVHIEHLAQQLANERGVEVKSGGFVSLSKPLHAKALKKRGYTVEGEVLTKSFHPDVMIGVAS